ncbi:haloalkane dehalogenase [Glaciecola sp. XM2]|uniref:haloalkane dehalogenase n=1 Tax=Glaciecola sp. XM2 TaxID=1914931 RepID=UPI001BDE5360|nr:haloalkane dehalogenase [Glaciecola sp. XM2]MBT1449428.1 haloalkane dehalogenase [Glaciecola sp. XM2]
MKIIKTPKTCFDNLPGYSFQENYIDVTSNDTPLMMHYVDYGDRSAPVILMLHGEPSWSYLYRNMINDAEAAGYRVIAPDLIGFGKSDKFDTQDAYTYASHLSWLDTFFNKLALNDVRLICQDWGGLLGLRLVAKYPERFSAVVAANTMLPTGDHTPPEAFLKWQAFSQSVELFPVSQVIQNATVNEVIDEVLAAYDAPFPTETHKAGVRKFPLLVPTTPDDPESQNNRLAWRALSQFTKPFMTAFSDSDPVTAGGDKIFQKIIPGCQGQAHTTIKNGGHFLQEDAGETLIGEAIAFFNRVN